MLGALFNVFDYKGNDKLVITLIECWLKLDNDKGIDKFIKPNEQLSINKSLYDF